MRWISERHEYEGTPFTIKGWHLESESDKDILIHCKRCGKSTPIKDCEKEPATGYRGDEVAVPIDELLCPKCRSWLATLDESDPKVSIGPKPLLSIQENGELCYPT